MTRNEILRRYPNASESFVKANLDPESAGTNTIMERSDGNGTERENAIEAGAAGKLHIKFISVRKRLCDPDNLAVKWLLDALRHSGVILDDSPDKISLEVTQRKCGRRRFGIGENEKEHTVIEIYEDSEGV